MKYDYILFDADETLFSFNNFAGLQQLFTSYGQVFTQADYDIYQQYNKQLWQRYQDNQIDAQFLQVERFVDLATRLPINAQQMNDEFLDVMVAICEPLPGARELLYSLRGKARLGIITNGLARMQHKRIEHTGLQDYFEWLVISEEFGQAKPQVGIFDYTFGLMGNPPKEKILMVGDTFSSDIIGGQNAGIDTCFLQHPNVALPACMRLSDADRKKTERGEQEICGAPPTYHITQLSELQDILLN